MSSTWLWSNLDGATKLIPIDKQADNDVVYLRGF